MPQKSLEIMGYVSFSQLSAFIVIWNVCISNRHVGSHSPKERKICPSA